MEMIGRASAAGIAAVLGAALLAGTGATRASPPAPDLALGKATFAQCSACHSVTKGQNGIGPTLSGVVGRKIGGVPGFTYSPALKAKAGAWTPAALNAYLADPKAAIPGNRMPYPGLKDAAKRAALVAYLGTVK